MHAMAVVPPELHPDDAGIALLAIMRNVAPYLVNGWISNALPGSTAS
ncbi:hypothetical protein [Rhodovulum steppense]|nr:hypothetical protein [Rhodovulum steppense]